MEQIDEYQSEEQIEGEYRLTAEVITDIATFSEVTLNAAPEPDVDDVDDVEDLPELDLFVFKPMEEIPAGELTPFEQQTLDVLLSGDLDPFDPFYLTSDGSIDTELCGNVWWAATVLQNDLNNAGIAPENFAAVAAEWLSV